MKTKARVALLFGAGGILVCGLVLLPAVAQDAGKPQIAVDPQTGRAVGAREMAPDELRKLIEQKAKIILIDVRDEAQYQQETIKGAIHIPFAELESRLKEIPKDTLLAFT
jgi:hypothetical protein